MDKRQEKIAHWAFTVSAGLAVVTLFGAFIGQIKTITALCFCGGMTIAFFLIGFKMLPASPDEPKSPEKTLAKSEETDNMKEKEKNNDNN